jgi:hypothetical protein
MHGLRTGANAIKLFTFVIYDFSYKARVDVPGNSFQTSLMFVNKANSLP